MAGNRETTWTHQKNRIKIFCFYEEIAIPVVGEVVPEESAILEQYSNVSIRANHMDMARFGSVTDSGYLAVCGALKDWVVVIEESISENDLVNLPVTHILLKPCQCAKRAKMEETNVW